MKGDVCGLRGSRRGPGELTGHKLPPVPLYAEDRGQSHGLIGWKSCGRVDYGVTARKAIGLEWFMKSSSVALNVLRDFGHDQKSRYLALRGWYLLGVTGNAFHEEHLKYFLRALTGPLLSSNADGSVEWDVPVRLLIRNRGKR